VVSNISWSRLRNTTLLNTINVFLLSSRLILIYFLTACKNATDVVVLIDISPSVHSCNYYKVRRFVVKITEEFQVGGANNSHFAMIHCSTYPHLDFHLNDKKFWDPIELEKKIINSVYTHGRTKPFIKRKLFFLFFVLELVIY